MPKNIIHHLTMCIDLSGSRDVRVSFAPEGINALDRMLSSYIHVLMKREKIYRDLGNKPMDELYFASIQELSDEDIDVIYRIDISVAWRREKEEAFNEIYCF